MPLLTRRQLIMTASAWACARAARIGCAPLERALASCPVTLESIPLYLTFDDGIETELARGESGPTIEVLNLLEARGIPATFFLHGCNTGLAEGGVLARMIRAGHRVGNHSFEHAGVTLADHPLADFMARRFLDTELRFREALAPYPDALHTYLDATTPRVYRRPGGGYDQPQGNRFLACADTRAWFEVERRMAWYRDKLNWLDGVYDYSGWHLDPLPVWATGAAPEDVAHRLVSGPNGLDHYLAPAPEVQPAATSRAALEGIIILLHDPDPRLVRALPLLLDALAERGAVYHVLPRPVDSTNGFTVGIGALPEIVLPPDAPVSAPRLP